MGCAWCFVHYVYPPKKDTNIHWCWNGDWKPTNEAKFGPCVTLCAKEKAPSVSLETVKFISQRNVNVQKSLLDANSNVFDIVWMVLTLREKGSREIRARPNCRYSPNQYFPRQDLSWRLEIIGQWFSSPEYQLRTAESISIHADLVLK